MPALLWLSLPALLDARTSATCTAFAEAWHTGAHDRVTRRLPAHGSGPTRLELAVRPLFVWARGDLRIADTVLPQPCATALERLAWVDASPACQPG